ncbi:hypothetical protein ACOSP7_019147 [Xanthoceras sorbifolium]
MLPCGVEDELPEDEAKEAGSFFRGPFFLFSKYHSGYPINLQHHRTLTLCLTTDIGKCSFNTRKRIHI